MDANAVDSYETADNWRRPEDDMYSAWGTYGFIVGIHSILRWLVVLAGLTAALRAWSGRNQGRAWSAADTAFGRLFVIAIDAQVLVGILLYGFFSAVIRSGMASPGLAFQSNALRFWVLEHPLAMVTALLLAHIGLARAKSAPAAESQRHALLFFGMAVLVVLVAIPWPLFTYGRGLWPMP